MRPIRLTIVETHPVQYNAPWFRHLAQHCPELELTVVYASRPNPDQQAVGFRRAFEWDVPLLQGYASRIVRESRRGDSFTSDAFAGLDVPEIGDAVLDTQPDVAMVAGWHSVTQVRAIAACRRRRIPLLYRGDTHLGLGRSGLARPPWHVKTWALLHRYAAHLAVGHRSRQYLRAHGVAPTRIYASPHSVDNEFFAGAAAQHLTREGRADARRAFGFEPGDFVVLFVGKLNERKRLNDAIEAVARLGASAALLVAGDGARADERRADAARLGVRATWAGFLNQREIVRAYAAADCLVLPSRAESWGLVVNEAMATGLPAVVSDAAGCAPDLVTPGETGDIFPCGDIDALAAALTRVRERGGRGTMADACRARIAGYNYAAAATGLVAASQAVARRRDAPRVIACCGGMVVVSGLERMTFEVMRVVRARGGAVHCVVNGWENQRIVTLAESIGASWSTAPYLYGFSRTLNPLRHLQALWETTRASARLLLDAARFRPTHLLVPEWAAVLLNAPAIAALRLFGVGVVFRIANAPERGRIYDLLWGRILPSFVTAFVPNSRFSYGRVQEAGVPSGKITLIRNALSRRNADARGESDLVKAAASRKTLLTVGQIAPFKGTHLAVDAALRLIADGEDAQALIVGALPEWPPELKDWARALVARVDAAGAADRVRFVGAREDVPALMRASYVLSAPILQEETFGNVALEARALGLPVVAFARGGLIELVTHRETGYLCPTADLEGLLEGLRYFLHDPAARARASAASLAATSAPENDCTAGEFERRWWAMFDRAGGVPG
ncbi:MAG: glycosyltransferase family 4 protein [Acidobacteria bacterium]|nr:glycosyltransferase family 4 protein [Acidobacteriota bacterium]